MDRRSTPGPAVPAAATTRSHRAPRPAHLHHLPTHPRDHRPDHHACRRGSRRRGLAPVAPAAGRSPTVWRRPHAVARWMVTFVGFPARRPHRQAAGRSGRHPSTAALLGGLVTGAILGAAQAWGLGRSGPPARQWVAATALGLSVGLGLGAAPSTSRPASPRSSSRARSAAWPSAAPRRWCSAVAFGRLTLAWPPVLAASGPSAGRSPPPPASTSTSSSPCSGPPAPSPSPPCTAVLAPRAEPAAGSAVMTRHVVFGTGQVGRLVAEQLVDSAVDVVASTARPSRTSAAPGRGRRRHEPLHHGSRAGADVVYFCLNAAATGAGPSSSLRCSGACSPAPGGRGPTRRARQPLRLRPDRRPGPRRDAAGPTHLRKGGDPSRHDARAARRPRRRRRRGRHRAGVGLLRAGHRRSALGETVFAPRCAVGPPR